jgi:hypothetical protein
LWGPDIERPHFGAQMVQERGSPRPVGIWLFVLGNVLLAAKASIPIIQVLLDPNKERWSPISIAWAPFVGVVLLTILVGACGTWAGFRLALVALLSALTIFVALEMVEYVFVVQFWLSHAYQDRLAETNWWGLSYGLRLLFWLAINYWYFLRQPTKAFFARRSAS